MIFIVIYILGAVAVARFFTIINDDVKEFTKREIIYTAIIWPIGLVSWAEVFFKEWLEKRRYRK